MGLASSQARLLNLTARMHDIEYKAQNLEAQKLQMANESAHVYQEYENALNKTQVQFKNISTDGSAKYDPANLDTLFEAGYKIQILVDGNWSEFAKADVSNSLIVIKEGDDADIDNTAKEKTEVKDKTSGTIVNYNGSYYKITEKNDKWKPIEVLSTSNKQVLNNLVEAGFITFKKPNKQQDGTTKYDEVNIATDTNLQEVSDELDLKKAEAKYEADMRKINQKDKKFDTDLAALEQERNAIKTEIETLKSVAKDNVDRTYKIFS